MQAHLKTLIAECPSGCLLKGIIPSYNNRNAVLLTTKDKIVRFLHGGKVIYESTGEPVREPKLAISSSGERVATGVPVIDESGLHYEVKVNGETIWRSPNDFQLYSLIWLEGDRLVWDGWPLESRGDSRYFENGKEVTGSLQFDIFIDKGMQEYPIVQENGVRYAVTDGARKHERPACCDDLHCSCDYDRRREHPLVEHLNEGGLRIRFKGLSGPTFHEIGANQISWVLSENQDRVGYIGMKYPTFITRLTRPVNALIEKTIDREDVKGKTNWGGWIAALLFNPYFGPGYFFIEATKRYYPVNHDTVWKRGWRQVTRLFFTPDNNLVAVVSDRSRQRVLIEETEGPRFDSIDNARYIPGEGVVYLAQKGNEIYRVTVS